MILVLVKPQRKKIMLITTVLMEEVSVNFVRERGVVLKTVGLPEIKPSFVEGVRLYALLGGPGWEKAYDVTEDDSYATMWEQANEVGCNYTVGLYTVSNVLPA